MGRARPTVADQLFGMRIRECRMMLGLSQHQLGELIGITYQQVYKYEHGINSLSAGRLYEIARELGTPVEQFFEGLEKENAEQLPLRQSRLRDVMRSVGEIENEEHREAIRQLTRALASRLLHRGRRSGGVTGNG
jgi:transcriptional regulator with XRE-family HTH domain